MKKNCQFLLATILLILSTSTIAALEKAELSQETSLISCQSKNNSAIKTLVLIIGEDPLLKQVAQITAFDLAFTDQLKLEIKKAETALNKKSMKKLFKSDFSLCVSLMFVKKNKEKDAEKKIIAIQVKDTENNDTLFEKTFLCSSKSVIVDSHTISSMLIPVLTGTQSTALSSLAFCKQFSPKQKGICVTDYACFTERTIIKEKSLNIAPSWSTNNSNHLFYSHFTTRNSQLKCFDFLTQKSRTICSYDGINMQPSCSNDGKQVVLSMSGNKGNTELYLYDQRLCQQVGKRVFKQLTNNGSSNVSPSLLSDGNVIFCSDFETGSPQIYHLETKTRQVKRITKGGGYCAGPSYNQTNNTVVYSKLINGSFQLFSTGLDPKNAREKQITNSKGDKLDPSWSPCGRYVAFTYDYVDAVTKKCIPQIAVLNYHSGIIRILTKDSAPKSFVCWTNDTRYHC